MNISGTLLAQQERFYASSQYPYYLVTKLGLIALFIALAIMGELK